MGSGCSCSPCSKEPPNEQKPISPIVSKPASPIPRKLTSPIPPRPVVRVPDPPPQPEPVVIPPKRTPNPGTPKRPEKVVEDIIIVWLNPPGSGTRQETNMLRKKMEGVVNNVVICTDDKQCIDFMYDIKDEKIFLVMPKSMAEDVAPKLQDDSKVADIYYFDWDKEEQDEEDEFEDKKVDKNEPAEEKEDADKDEGEEDQDDDNDDDDDEAQEAGSVIPGNKHEEVVRSFTFIKPLCKQMNIDAKRCTQNLIKPLALKDDSDRIVFMYNQLFQEIILTTKDEDANDIHNFCKKHFGKNDNDKKYLQDLETTYSRDKAIYWYSREGCLYKMSNRALRLQECDILYGLRHFIRHLHEQIVDRQPKQTTWKGKKFYRGQFMEKQDFERMKENKGGAMFFPNFLSTTTDRNVAMGFIEDNGQDSRIKSHVRVLFKIIVKKDYYSPFANITKESRFKGEKEWLFSMGSVFRIDAITQTPDRIQHVELTSMKYEDQERESLKEHLMNLVKDENISLSFGRLLYQMAKWEDSKKMYLIASDTEKKDYRKRAVRNNLLSLELEIAQLNCATAFPSYDQLLKDEQSEKNPNPKDLAIVHNNMATGRYKEKDKDTNKQMELASANLRQAIENYNARPNGDVSFIATVYNNMACVLNSQGKHEQALINSEKCLGIRSSLLPSNHPSLAIAYNTAAITYNHLRQFSESKGDRSKTNEYARKALENAEKAVNIDQQALPLKHPQLEIHQKNRDHLKNRVNNSE